MDAFSDVFSLPECGSPKQAPHPERTAFKRILCAASLVFKRRRNGPEVSKRAAEEIPPEQYELYRTNVACNCHHSENVT